MRRLVALGSAFALAAVLAGCSGGESEGPDADDSPIASPPPTTAPAGTPEPESEEPEPVGAESPEPAAEPEAQEPAADGGSLDGTFKAMLEAIEREGEEGLTPFLADPEAGDMWRVSDWDWTGGPCAEGGPGESACVGYFTKDGREMENVFGFDKIDGEWLLVESWVAWE